MTDDHGPEIAHNQDEVDVHFRLGQLTRQLHDSLNALGIADKLHGAAEELPDAKSRLSYIARLTGEAAEDGVIVHELAVAGEFDELLEQVFDIVEEVRAFRVARDLGRRLVEVPLGLDHPYWVDDPNFDLDFHIREIHLARPGMVDQLADQVSRIVGRPMDRSRPLWEVYVIDGLDNGNWAMLTKYHHATIDGAAGQIMLNILTDTGLVGRYVTDWAGPNAVIKSIKLRLGVPWYAYDTITFRGEVTAVEGDLVTLKVVGSNSLGDHVIATSTLTMGEAQ